MKSFGNLWHQIASKGNLREAWLHVRLGHASSKAFADYEESLDDNLDELRRALLGGTWRPGAYRQFSIRDPKPRVISCAPVADRVVHHALCNVVVPVLERRFVPVSFACRKGFGSHSACALARRYVGSAAYFCKMDVRHYFDTIDHGRLADVLLPLFREREVRNLIRTIIDHPVPGLPTGLGLPIGNLTSQLFANAYLDGFDHDALAGLGGRAPIGYLRYMDDFVFFTDSKAEAWRLHDESAKWLLGERGLEVKDAATLVAPVAEGVPFLGLRIWPNCWRLRRARYLRTRRTFARRVRQWREGVIDDRRFAQCCASSDGSARWFGFKGILDDLVTEEGSSSGSNRAKRGGSWNNNASNCTSSNRNNNNPSNENNNNGFRLASALPGSGPHSAGPALRASEDEHARPRPASSLVATAAPGQLFAQKAIPKGATSWRRKH